MRRRIPMFVAIIESILLLAHFFVYETLVFFWQPSTSQEIKTLRITFAILSVSFVIATLLAFRTCNIFMRTFYTLAAAWLGTLNFLFIASALCWIAYPLVILVQKMLPQALALADPRRAIVATLFSLAALTDVYAIVNAARLRVTRVTLQLPGLPDSWRGRTAALVTDTHLGHVRGRRFTERVVNKLQALEPAAVFFSGDMFDGTKADLAHLTAPWKKLSPPLGAYFVTGNHEEFTDPEKYLTAIAATGIRVLQNEMLLVEGLQILGVNYRDSTHDAHFTGVLERMDLDRSRASILLLHQPARLPISEKRGISLVLSGHTHGGQVFPSTWIAARIWGTFVHGLSYSGAMAVYTSYGAGTWGPPLRFRTFPEITLIHFE